MKLGMSLHYYADSFASAADRLADYERIGLDRVMVAEVYSVDAVSQNGVRRGENRTSRAHFRSAPDVLQNAD